MSQLPSGLPKKKKRKGKIGEIINFDLTHARHDPAHCLAHGLFRSLKRGDRKKLKLDITYNFGTQELRFIGFEPLGVDDLRLLQGIVAFAGPSGLLLSAEPKTEIGKQLRFSLDTKLDAASKDASIVKSQLAKLLHEIGYEDGGDKRRQAINSLRRMSNITVITKDGTKEASFHFLSYAIEKKSGWLLITLNPRITEAILGNHSHTRIDMHEVRALKSDPARLIHQRLCGWIDPGKTRSVEIDTLASYVWPDEAEGSTLRMRRQTTKKALDELRTLGWNVTEYVANKFEITRPKMDRISVPTLPTSHANVNSKDRLNVDKDRLNVDKDRLNVDMPSSEN